jgi:hypothetical protein
MTALVTMLPVLFSAIEVNNPASTKPYFGVF